MFYTIQDNIFELLHKLAIFTWQPKYELQNIDAKTLHNYLYYIIH